MRLNRFLCLVLCAGLLVLLVAGCSTKSAMDQSSSVTSRPTPTASSSDRTYYLLSISTGLSYWADAKAGFEARAQQLGVKGIFTGPRDYDPSMQARELDQIIAKKPAGIIIVPADANALKPGIDRAIDAGIPVLTQDTDAPNSKRFCYIGTDNYSAGLRVGEELARAIGGKGKVGISMLVGQWNIAERARGVKDALKKFPGISVVATCDDKGDVATSPQANAAMLTAHPDLAGIAGLDAASGVGSARAVIEAGKTGKVQIVCFDRDDDMLQQIKDGVITASIAQKSYLMAWLGLTLLDSLATDQVKHLADWRSAAAPPLPSTIDTGVMVIDKSNVDQFFHNAPQKAN